MSPGTSTTMLRLALAGLLASAPCALWAGEVTGISVNQGSTGTRVEIQLAGAGQYKTLSLKGPDRLVVGVDLGLGKASRTVWTCDLTHRYIDINADYRS